MIDPKELIPAEKRFLPEVVDQTGEKIVGPELEAVTQLVTQMAQLAQLARIRKSLEREHFQGELDERTIEADDKAKVIDLIRYYPFTPWVTAYFYNDGLDPIYISINNAHDWKELKKGEDSKLNFAKADKRIELIYYKCDPGETASVRVEGKY